MTENIQKQDDPDARTLELEKENANMKQEISESKKTKKIIAWIQIIGSTILLLILLYGALRKGGII